MKAMEQLPDYMKPFFKIIMDEYALLEEQLAKEGRAHLVHASKQGV